MKKLMLWIPLVAFSLLAYAQEEDELDSLAFGDSPHRPFLLSILDVPVLEPMSSPSLIVPNENILCYDKTITFKTSGESLNVNGCLFIDTEDGFMSFIPPKRERYPDCLIKDQEDDFNLTVIGLAGNVFNYQNFRKNGELQHMVSTGNSENYVYAYSATPDPISLELTEESKEFLDGKIKAWVYERQGGGQKWYLFGKEFPPALTFSPKKYLGNFGIGYHYSDKGLYLIMQVVGTGYDAEIIEIEDQMTCFDSRKFRHIETEFFNSAMESIDRKKNKLDEKAGSIDTEDYCAGLKARNIQYEQEMLSRQEASIQQAKQGNLQQNTTAMQAMSQGMFNYDDLIQQQIYETELEICQQEKILTFPANARSPGTVQRVRDKIQCLEQQKAMQIETQQKLLALNDQLRDDPLISQKKNQLIRKTATMPCK